MLDCGVVTLSERERGQVARKILQQGNRAQKWPGIVGVLYINCGMRRSTHREAIGANYLTAKSFPSRHYRNVPRGLLTAQGIEVPSQPLPVLTLLFSVSLALTDVSSALTINVSDIINHHQAEYLTNIIGNGPQVLTRIFTVNPAVEHKTFQDFHAAVDETGDTFTVIQLTNGEIIGGYDPTHFARTVEHSGEIITGYNGAFLFNLTEDRLFYQTSEIQSIHSYYYGPNWSWDLMVEEPFTRVILEPISYGDISGPRQNIVGDFDVEGVSFYHTIRSLEVFSVGPRTSVPDGGSTLPLLSLGFGGMAFFRSMLKPRASKA